LESNSGYIVEKDGWGRVIRRRSTSPYGEPVQVALADKGDIDGVVFESADLAARYEDMCMAVERAKSMRQPPYLFIKVGGPYLRSSFLRGEHQWYIDIATDETLVSEVATRVTDHLIAVGLEAVRRSRLSQTSIWIFDDVASNRGLLISPQSYERLFLPQIGRMVTAYKDAGVAHVGFHSDGDIRSIVDDLVDVGISILNPLEPRANMDVVDLRRRYGERLALVGGLCNSVILPTGSDEEVRRHLDHVLSISDEGGLVVASHSVGPDISQERYEFLTDLLCQRGRPRPGHAN
jgi:uroporphyrinogen decarboxylase